MRKLIIGIMLVATLAFVACKKADSKANLNAADSTKADSTKTELVK